ncbi:MAG: penicillin-binding protein 2 [Actinomycetota bacterium]|nr:penicillin-binding protein 2 [Actinomycetota bacterium]
MNRQIRRLGVALVILFIALFLQLNYLQVVDAKRLNDNPTNTRAVVRDFSQPRGVIQTSDGTVLAESKPTGGQFANQRSYPQANLYSHITGFFSFNFGSDGVERTYNDALTGRTNNLSISRIGDWLLQRKRTANVSLTLSNDVQHVASDALGAHKGAVVALDPRNGAILAMADYPTYDPNPLASHDLKAATGDWNQLNADRDKPLLSRAYRERYFPGSSFKVVTAATALQSGKATVTNPVFPDLSELPLPQSSQPIRNFGGETCGGALPDALRVSCNTAFAQLGLDLGGPTLSDGANSFGFNQVPPIDLPFGAASSFPDPAAFVRDKPALAKSAIGQQDVQATPLQMALVAACIANNGTIMTPHVMKEIRDSEGQVIQTYDAHAWKDAVRPDVAQTTRDMMIGVVQSGTGTRAQLPDVQVAGKTGTAQTGRDTSHVWFIGFAPAEAPRVAVAVMLEDQPNVSEATGGVVAAPIAAQVLQAGLVANP